MKIVNDIGFLKNEAKEFMSSPEFLVMCVVFIVKSTILYAIIKDDYSEIRKRLLEHFNLKDILRER
ncbi:MAG: hypothetical protein KAH32_05340, partial [Chlamydiia bacterium]|nr:hypothetical protein [Chlamydiia bacterium]